MDDDDFKKFCAHIKCDNGCGYQGPSKRCARCKCVFYCSVDCQRQHWNREHKKECIPTQKRIPIIPLMNETLVTPLNSECGICLEEPIKQPVVLPACRHAFCFPCLKSWQGDSKKSSQDKLWEMLGQTDKVTKVCPTCRKDIGKSVSQDALLKAHMYQTQARLLPRSADGVDRMELLQMALSECKRILDADPNDLDALTVRVSALVQFDAAEAVKAAKQLLRVNEVALEKMNRLQERAAQVTAVLESGNTALARAMCDDLMSHYNNVEPFPVCLGDKPSDVFDIRIMLAKAYENLNQWYHGLREYYEMLDWYGENTFDEKNEAQRMRKLMIGFARCSLETGDIDEAHRVSQHVLSEVRHLQGVHVLFAKVQRACAHAGNKFSITMADAVETMYRGVIYEAPWDEDNREANREFLQELLNEIGEEN
jgi:tetratricopeptide (TPR) repeat protein